LTLTVANNVLIIHKHDSLNNINKGQKNNINNTDEEKKGTSTEKDEILEMMFVSIKGERNWSGKAEYISPACRHRELTPKEHMAINKVIAKDRYISFIITEEKHEENLARGWSNAPIQFQFYQSSPM
jgi:hypothetical protein